MTTLKRDELVVHVAESSSVMGACAAADIASEIRACLGRQPSVRMIFAAAPSQSEMLGALRLQKDIDWSRVTAFHMDEYLGLAADAPQRFGLWLRRAIFDHLPFAAVHLIQPETIPTRPPRIMPRSLTPRPSILFVAVLARTVISPLTIHPRTLKIHSPSKS